LFVVRRGGVFNRVCQRRSKSMRRSGDRSETWQSPSLRRERNRSLSRQRPELVPAVVLNMGVGDLNSQRLKASNARHSKASRGMKASDLQSAVQSEPEEIFRRAARFACASLFCRNFSTQIGVRTATTAVLTCSAASLLAVAAGNPLIASATIRPFSSSLHRRRRTIACAHGAAAKCPRCRAAH
jgi:hypothetical protein